MQFSRFCSGPSGKTQDNENGFLATDASLAARRIADFRREDRVEQPFEKHVQYLAVAEYAFCYGFADQIEHIAKDEN